MLEKGLKDDKLEKFGEEKEIEGCEILKEKIGADFEFNARNRGNNDKFKDLGIGIEETKKHEKSEVINELGTDLARQQVNLSQLVLDKKELAKKFEKVSNVVDKVLQVK